MMCFGVQEPDTSILGSLPSWNQKWNGEKKWLPDWGGEGMKKGQTLRQQQSHKTKTPGSDERSSLMDAYLLHHKPSLGVFTV